MQESHHDRARKHPANENRNLITEFKRKCANFRRIIKENKKTIMEELHIINKSTNTNIYSIGKTNIQFLESDDDRVVTQAHDIANTLAKKCQKNLNNINSTNPTIINNHIYHDQIHNDSNSLPNSPLTLKEMSSIFTSTKNSAPGPDNIPNSLLKMLPKTGMNYL